MFRKDKYFLITSIIFTIWAMLYIFKSSFVAVDGERYFMLFDDAMISMRFAWNYAHGLGLVWNEGEYVQGYTNLLMTLIMSVSSLLFNKQHAVLIIQILGIPTVLGIAFITAKIAHKYYGVNNAIHKLVFISVLLYYPIVYWSLMGMETGLLSVLVLLSILFSLRYVEDANPKDLFVIAILMGLAFMTRNESAIFAGIIFIYVCFYLLRKKLFIKKSPMVLFAGIIYFLFILGQLIFQYLYYGEWLPNTYVLKLTGMSFSDRVINGLGFIEPFLIYTSPLIVLSFVYLIKKFSIRNLYLISFPITSIFYQVYVGGDPWLYWRIMAPTMPLLLLLFIVSIYKLVPIQLEIEESKERSIVTLFRKRALVPSVVIGCILIFADHSENSAFLREMALRWKPYQSDIAADNVNMALILGQLTTPDATIGVYWAGSMPYYLDRKTIDFFGKSDKYIANLPPDLSGSRGWNGMNSVPGHNKYDLQYSLVKLQPSYIPGFSMGLQDFSEWGALNYQMIKVGGYSFLLRREAKEIKWDSIK